MHRTVGVLVALVLITIIPARPRAQQTTQIGGVGITVFEDSNFRGKSATFRDDVPDLRRFDLNDRITSLRVTPGELWEACIDINYGGRCQVFSGSEPDLKRRSGWNDEISSLRRVRGSRGGGRPPIGGSQLVLYDHVSFRGSSRMVTAPTSSLGSYGSRVESLRVDGGRWEICEGSRWSGRCIIITENVPDLSRRGLKGVGSVRPK
jgi:Beta/Gamma crystallin